MLAEVKGQALIERIRERQHAGDKRVGSARALEKYADENCVA
jgi:hypothetical protein